MFQKKQVILSGFLFFAFGIILILSSANGVTGFAVAEGVQVSTSLSGLFITLLGSVLLVVGMRRQERVVRRRSRR